MRKLEGQSGRTIKSERSQVFAMCACVLHVVYYVRSYVQISIMHYCTLVTCRSSMCAPLLHFFWHTTGPNNLFPHQGDKVSAHTKNKQR